MQGAGKPFRPVQEGLLPFGSEPRSPSLLPFRYIRGYRWLIVILLWLGVQQPSPIPVL